MNLEPRRPLATKIQLAWALQLPLAAIFAFTAWRKFTAHPTAVETIEALGAGQWLRVAIGIVEFAGAIGLLIPQLAPLAAACLALLMLGAAATHVLVIGGSPTPALVLMLANLAVCWLRHLNSTALQTGPQDIKSQKTRK